MASVSSSDTDFSFIEMLLREQQELTAVERFAQQHEQERQPLQAKHYRDLLPTAAPSAGEQYAFEVDLDVCSGCKACVTACHSMNGLDDGEVWRSVGLLHGGTPEAPVIQHVTTACHHCVDPACMDGCPVKAYEKDAETGIVMHLDDQCFGCQYCIFKCPYDVPKYNASLGIVRKCDMCRDRLVNDEAPACVQSCPNKAIRISVVKTRQVIEESETNLFLPGAPEPRYTLPTTRYDTKRPLPRNLLPADYYSARTEHAHHPLIWMLVLTQMSAGAFVVEQVLGGFTTAAAGALIDQVRPVHLIAALMLGLAGMGASVMHLGRPMYAFRAVIGLATSWLSREIIAFGLFAGMAAAYTLVSWLAYRGVDFPLWLGQFLGIAAAGAGLLAIYCSVMVYVDTRRPFWNAGLTATKFFLTAVVTGIPTALLISIVAVATSTQLSVEQMMTAYGRALCVGLMIAVTMKLLFESVIFTHLRQRQHLPLKRTAMLMIGDLGIATTKRYFFGIFGGIVLPALLCFELSLRPDGFHPAFVSICAALSLFVVVIGEWYERYLFFTAVVAPRMPGGIGS